MPTKNLTQWTVEHAPRPAAGRVELWDAALPGFGLRITKAGARTWVLMYRAGGVKRRLTIGTFPKTSLKDARQAARDALQGLDKGIDPGAAKKAAREPQRAPDTVENVVAEFIKRYPRGQGADTRLRCQYPAQLRQPRPAEMARPRAALYHAPRHH
ncbi:MAG: Arm DNA-binding domain-containing protein [Aliidongia sp.]